MIEAQEPHHSFWVKLCKDVLLVSAPLAGKRCFFLSFASFFPPLIYSVELLILSQLRLTDGSILPLSPSNYTETELEQVRFIK